MFCAFSVRDFKQFYSWCNAASMFANSLNIWQNSLQIYITTRGRCFLSRMWLAQRSSSSLVYCAAYLTVWRYVFLNSYSSVLKSLLFICLQPKEEIKGQVQTEHYQLTQRKRHLLFNVRYFSSTTDTVAVYFILLWHANLTALFRIFGQLTLTCVQHVCFGNERWTGLGLNCIRTKTNFVGFGMDPYRTVNRFIILSIIDSEFYRFRIKILLSKEHKRHSVEATWWDPRKHCVGLQKHTIFIPKAGLTQWALTVCSRLTCWLT